MEKYNPDAICPKCGGNDISNHHKNHRHLDCSLPYFGGDIEHIDRHCRNCHYEWAELPLDFEGNPREADKDDNAR